MTEKKAPQNEQKSTFDTPIVSEKKQTKYFLERKYLLIGGIILTAILIVSIGLYYFIQYQKEQKLLKNPLLASEIEQESVISKVGQLTQLPAGEQPTIARVSDITKLQNQPFFQKAKNGDYVLIYSKAKEAILYDPVGNKIVQVGPIFINKQSSTGTALGAQTIAQPVTIAIYNGTAIAGLAKKTEQSLQQKMKNVTVVKEANASTTDYTQTIVIDLTGKNAAAAAQLAGVLKGTVGSLPSGEVIPANAEILVILGKK